MMINANKKLNVILFIIMAVIIVMTSYLMVNLSKQKSNNIVCSAQILSYKQASRMDLMFSFELHDEEKEGFAIIEGTISHNNVKKEVVNRRVYFSYNKSNNNYTFTQDSLIKSPDETISEENAQLNLIDLFWKIGSRVNYTIFNQGDTGYIFFNGKIPKFFCDKV